MRRHHHTFSTFLLRMFALVAVSFAVAEVEDRSGSLAPQSSASVTVTAMGGPGAGLGGDRRQDMHW